MWDKKKKSNASGKIDSLIGPNTTIQGDLRFNGGLHIDGRIIGNIVSDGEGASTLIVSKQGYIEGSVQVDHVVLNGKVKGNVYSSERVELASEARVEGDVYYDLLEMAMGAEVNGSLVHQSKEQQQKDAVGVKGSQDVVESAVMGYLDEKAPH